MNKFYFVLFFSALTVFATAQNTKAGEPNFTSVNVPAKVLKFYPNPATTVINFELLRSQAREVTLQVYNFIGKKVYESNNISQKTIIPLSDFFRGVYIFQLRDKTGRIIESGKFQVAK